MAYIEVKPILFTNSLNKKIFLMKNKLCNVLYQEKNMIAMSYNIEQYKMFFDKKTINDMYKYKATFFIISDRQFAYIAHKLLGNKYNINDIKVSSFFNKIESSNDFVDDTYEEFNLKELNDFFSFNIMGRISEIHFNRNNEMISIKSNGVVAFSNVDSDEINDILILIREAYNDSQR